ncbi:hypothetical protein J6590_043635 [Homalodisca vitripennis]|nr:hypothetical protein J6590_043635 [Homalodisca vitripennis]
MVSRRLSDIKCAVYCNGSGVETGPTTCLRNIACEADGRPSIWTSQSDVARSTNAERAPIEVGVVIFHFGY